MKSKIELSKIYKKMDRYILPELYGIDKAGKERIWKVWVIDNTVFRESGLVTGKKQTHQRDFFGKNIGKVNETSDQEQAKIEAENKWVKQLEKDYFPRSQKGIQMMERVNAAKAEGTNLNASAAIRKRKEKKKKVSLDETCALPEVEIEIKPMKAATWEVDQYLKPLPKVLKYFDFDEGVYVQTKLDGVRVVARRQEDGIVMTTNNKNQFPWFCSLREEIDRFIGDRDVLDGLDGELYTHKLIDEDGNELYDNPKFLKIQGITSPNRSAPHPLEDQICFYAFDLVDLSGRYTQDERMEMLDELFDTCESDKIVKTETEIIYDVKDIGKLHDKWALQNYEGVIVRSKDLKYTDKRSLMMRKFKYFEDREYPIIGIKKDKGVADTAFSWELVDPETDERFTAKPAAPEKDRLFWYQNWRDYVGRELTVKFQEYTERGVPRFGVAKGFIREDQ